MGAMFPWGAAALIVVIGFAMVFTLAPGAGSGGGDSPKKDPVELPEPRRDGSFSLEKAIDQRRSQRSFAPDAVSLAEVGQLLWAAQGITDSERGYRSAPSAGATFPLDTYLLAGNVDGLGAGIYRYSPEDHSLVPVRKGDLRAELREAALGQASAGSAAASMVLAATYERTTGRYQDRGIRYTHMEAGHAAQNVYLQGTAAGLGMVAIGAFEDEALRALFRLSADQEPLYVLPFGRPKTG